MNTFLFTKELLQKHSVRYRDSYGATDPFPHVVLDDFLPVVVADEIEASFPGPSAIAWKDKIHEHSKKLASSREETMPPAIRNFLLQCNSSTFMTFLEELTGIAHLIPDPHYEGGGMHQIERGGFLDVHADFNQHHIYKLDRRLNLLLYLNKDWKEEYGGHLELWDRDRSRCIKKVLPVFNRCVVFSTSDFSFHGHPAPLQCPPGRTRKSLALYYYTNERPPGETAGVSYTTTYAGRHGLRYYAKRLLPPIVVDAARSIRRLIKK